MTAPALTDEQVNTVKVLATSAAFNYHSATVPAEQQVDLALSFAVHGDLRLVAADVLEAAAGYAEGVGVAGSSGGIKRTKIDGEVEIERFASTDVRQVHAATWLAIAKRLRGEVHGVGLPGIVKSPVAGMVAGSSTEPVFSITRPAGEA